MPGTVPAPASPPPLASGLRREVARERLQQMVMPFAIGAAFLALFFWARRSPLPALSTALALWSFTGLVQEGLLAGW